MDRRPRFLPSRRLVSPVLALALALPVASAAHAQQLPHSRFVPSATEAALVGGSALAARDSAARYLHTARVRRWSSGALVTGGVGAVAAAYVQFGRSGRMGMNGGQAATFAAGAGAGLLGVVRWLASRESYRTAARWTAVADASPR